MLIKHVFFVVSTFFPPCAALFSMDMKEIKSNEKSDKDEIQLTIPQSKQMAVYQPNSKKCWPYKGCSKPYRKSIEDRTCLSTCCAGCAGGAVALQEFKFCISMCTNRYDSCGEACHYNWAPTGLYACNSTCSTCFSIFSWGLTSIVAVGIFTSVCAWNPCCSAECIVTKCYKLEKK